MTESGLPDGFVMRAPAPSDAEAVAAALSASRVADGDVATSVEDVLTDWAEVDLDEEAVVVCTLDGKVVAGADVLSRQFVRVSVYGYVHPDWRRLGIGRALVEWGERWTRDRAYHAPAGARIVVDHYIPSVATEARRLFEAMGYYPLRSTLIMRAQLGGPPAAELPDGATARSYVPGRDDQALFEAGEAAFADLWGRPPGTLEGWIAPTRAKNFDAGLWFLAEDVASGKIIGLCLAQMTGGQGWIRSLGVRREARGRGLGRALLETAFRALYERGARTVELSVDADSPTNAPRVYQRAGMTVDRTFLLYQKVLRSGRDLSTLS